MSLIIKVGNKVHFGIGSYASLSRTFTNADIQHFADFVKDEDPVHFKQEALASLGFEKTFVYGMMPTALFTKLYLQTFISPVYLSQTVNFLAPIYVDEEIEVKCVVSQLELTKSNKMKCFIESTVRRVEKNIIAVSGNGLLLLKPETVEFLK
jgi:3-hydroxybutyryl-CoA dehydratase